jgi:periplasmic protein TonB
LAALGSLFAALTLVLLSSFSIVSVSERKEATVELTLVAPPPSYVPPPEPPPVVTRPKPKPKERRATPTPPPEAKTLPNEQTPEPVPANDLSTNTDLSPEMSGDVSTQPISPPLDNSPQPAPARPVSSSSSQSIERAYEKRLKDLIESKKVYPTGRQASIERPEGRVEVCMSLNRNGELITSSMASRSGSIILDRAALRLVSSLSYPAFPSAAFSDDLERQFCVVLDYRRK